MTSTQAKQQHTPGPWHFDHVRIFAGRSLIADCQSLDNARRIVACVNAAEGISDADLATQFRRAKQITSERDALRARVAALEVALTQIERDVAPYERNTDHMKRIARAALAGK